MTSTTTRAPAPPPTGSERVQASQLAGLAARVPAGAGEREWIEVEKPATGELLASVPRCTPEDVEQAVRRARRAQASWRSSGWAERQAILLRFHNLVLDRREEVLDLLQLEGGKARRHAFEEILDV